MIKKETLHILRDKRTMLILLCMPIVLTLLFGFAISTEIISVDIAAVADKRTDGVNDAVQKLSNNNTFIFHGFISQSEADEQLRAGKIKAAIVFHNDYDKLITNNNPANKKAIQVILDASNTNSATAIGAYIQGIFMQNTNSMSAFETHYLFNPQMKSAFNFVPGILGMIFMLICAMMTSVSIVREKETGTMEILLVSPINPRKIIISKMIPYFILSCIILAIILTLAQFVLQVPVANRLWELIIISIIYLLLSLALGLLISTLASKQATALLFSAMVLLLPIIMLSGMVFPIENMPNILQYVSCIVPARWYISAARKLMIEGQPFVFILKEFFILLSMLFVLMTISLKKFNDRLE